MFRDGTIPSYGNNDVTSADLLPPRCDSRGPNDSTSSSHHLTSPSCEKKPRVDLGLINSSKRDGLQNTNLFSRGHSRSVSPPSNSSRHLQNGCYSPESNIPGNNVMSHLDGLSLATHIQQMYRQQLAAASQILAANKIAANAAMESNEDGREITPNAFAAAAMSNLFALDPAFKAFLNENEDREEKFADADDPTNDLNEDNGSFEDDAENEKEADLKNHTNGGVSPPRIRIGNSSPFNKFFEEKDSDSVNPNIAATNGRSNNNEKSNKGLDQDFLNKDATVKSSMPTIITDIESSSGYDDEVFPAENSSHTNSVITETSNQNLLKTSNLNRPNVVFNEKKNERSISENIKEPVNLPSSFEEEKRNCSETFANYPGSNSMSPIPGTSKCSTAWTQFLPEDEEMNEPMGSLTNENNIGQQSRNNVYGESSENNSSSNCQEVQ